MIVSNSTPLIELSKIRRLELLRDVYGTLVIPKAVYTEVVINGEGKPGAKERKRLAGNSVGEPLLIDETRFIVRS